MKQDYQECFQNEAEALELILCCWQILSAARAARRGSKATLRQLPRTFCFNHGLANIYVQNQISVLDPYPYPSFIPVP